MNERRYILALDQGTTSSRAILFDLRISPVASAQAELTQYYPKEGWVEHDPMEILDTQLKVMREALLKAGIGPGDLASIGITNQRETTILWDKTTGKPICNAVVWQCRRTADICETFIRDGLTDYVRERTGLVIDAYFSASKIKWILDNVPGARTTADKGDLLFGTVDTWLLWNLTGGKAHATDVTNASRTMLFDIHRLTWDGELLKAMGIPAGILPAVFPSIHDFGNTAAGIFGTAGDAGSAAVTGSETVPIRGIAGDQHAALFGQMCHDPGMVKNTYGTGAFLMMNTGEKPVLSHSGLLTTIAYGDGHKTFYALEGSVFIAGAAVQWLRDELGLIERAEDSETCALRVSSTGGVYLVPAFTGLGAPYWDMGARGVIVGLTRGTDRNHIVRAALESMAYQTADLVLAIVKDSGIPITVLKADGGAAANNFLLQFQADILGIPVARPAYLETTALGAACLAGLGAGVWGCPDELSASREKDTFFHPAMGESDRGRLVAGWRRAVERSRDWV